MTYSEVTKEFYKDWLGSMFLKRLVAYEKNLSLFLDSELFEDSIFQDEALAIYSLMQDECVRRCYSMVDSEEVNHKLTDDFPSMKRRE